MAASSPGFVLSMKGSAPYPGVRPFEASESDRFFGRNRDADLLCDKILSGRLTVLYAQSGLGKSSLLRAKVIPLIEALHSDVIYFDAWAQEDPLGALKDNLIRAASELGITDAGRGSPTLTELARLLTSYQDRGLILVLDQFEEFLVHHGESLDPVRSELAALLRASKLDVTIVLSLREEFLAALEPLRDQILNLFQSTYRLENLDEDGVREAISHPAERFGGACEPELTERLIADLRGRTAAAATPGASQLVELPMLQLVCLQLWERAAEGRLTLALYEQMGGAQRILDEYVRSLMPGRWRDQRFTARLLLHLAPASGLKMSFATSDLVAITGLEHSAVRRELDRLAGARILRTRVYRTAERYELQHDAFIPVLQAWRHSIIDRERRMLWVRRLLLSAASVGLVTAIWSWFFHYQHEQASVLDAMEQRRLAAESRSKAAEQKSTDELKLRDEKERELREVEMARRQEGVALRQAELERQTADMERRKAETLLGQNQELKDKLEHWQTGGIVTDLRDLPLTDRARFAPSRFDVVTFYVLHRVEGPGRMQELRDMLEKNADLLPEDYGILTTTEAPNLPADWPLRLEYPTTRALDAKGFDAFWREYREWFVSNWALPLPTHVRLAPNAYLPGDQFRLVGGGGAVVQIDPTVPPGTTLYLIRTTPGGLQPGPERDFLQQFDKEWQRYSPRTSVDYRLVPHWSLPVWKLAGQTAVTPGGVAAYAAILELTDRPDPLFSTEAVDALLEQTAKNFPNTVAEARAAVSTADLATELRSRARSNPNVLTSLPQILDNIRRGLRASSAAENKGGGITGADAQSNRLPGSVPQGVLPQGSLATSHRLGGPWPRQQAGPGTQNVLATDNQRRYDAYDDFASLSPALHVIQIWVSGDLVPELFPGNALSAPLSTGIDALKSEIYSAYGLNPPGFHFQPPSDDRPLRLNTIRVEVRSDGPLPLVNRRRVLNGPDKLKSLLAELRGVLQDTREMWLTAENTNAVLTSMPPNTRGWIEKKYSLTDVKELMRTAISGGKDVSVRYPVWLVSSLPFWALADDPLDGTVIGRRLADTQRARVHVEVPPETELRRHLETGANALVRDDPDTAQAEFRVALQTDANAARNAFPAVWARRAPDVWMNEFDRQHGNLDFLLLAPTDRSDLDDLSRSAKEQGNDRAVWQVGLYRLAASSGKDPNPAAALRELLMQAPAPNEIPADQARWLALRFFKEYSPLHVRAGDEQLFAVAKALIKSAVARLEPLAAVKAFADVGTMALASSTPNWGWPLLEELAKAGPDRPAASLNIELAWRLCTQERPEQLLQALKLADGYEKILAGGKLSEKELTFQSQVIAYVRAIATFGLGRNGERVADAEPLLRKLLGAENAGIQQPAYIELMDLLSRNNRFAEAEELGRQATDRWPDSSAVGSQLLTLHLRKTDPAGVRAVADLTDRELVKPSAKAEIDDWYSLAALSAILAKRPGWQSTVEQFLKREHAYVDYVRMMAAAYEDSSSSTFAAGLRERWARVDPASWPDRLRNGDVSAWREMLMGSFLGKNESRDLVLTLTDEARWKKSGLSQLSEVRGGLECEAWFYDAMRARAHGERDRMLESLRRCEQTGMKAYYEYAMAFYLLAHPD